MSYRNNQFHNIGEAEGAGIPLTGDNPKFVYPDNTVRIHNFTHNQGLVSKKLDRGYIRSLLTEAQGQQIPIKRCDFQFNPSHLKQSVSMNSGQLNFWQQDPGQIAQPMGSEVNFSFEMFFDRSMELNGADAAASTDTSNPWASGDPSQVGVLRDISAFYGVIGQGMTEDTQDYALAQYKQNIEWEFAADKNYEDEDFAKAQENIDEFFANSELNMGNTAFLLPLPVRIMFSSLYMVEGYVTNSTVVYTKFNTAMVPMQATLGVSIRALYIGFAKKNTFVTNYLDKAADLAERERESAAEEKRSAYRALLSEVGKIRVIPVVEDGITLDDFFQPQVKTRLACSFPNAKEDGAVAELFESDTSLSIAYVATFTVYGPFDNKGVINLRTGKGTDGEVPGGSPLLRLVCVSPEISSLDAWIADGVPKSYSLTGDLQAFIEALNGETATGWSVGDYSSANTYTPDNSKFYSVKIEVRTNIVLAGQVVVGDNNVNSSMGSPTDTDWWDAEWDKTYTTGLGPGLDAVEVDALPEITDEDAEEASDVSEVE